MNARHFLLLLLALSLTGCAGDTPRPDAKLVHFTGGIPLHPETRGCEYTREWMQEAHDMNSSLNWDSLMSNSVHATRVAQAKVRRELEQCADGSVLQSEPKSDGESPQGQNTSPPVS